jgi:hypothetical protein
MLAGRPQSLEKVVDIIYGRIGDEKAGIQKVGMK